ncbi:MAG: hypothetical protein ACK4NE_03490 [Albidovulum sp.]
MRILSARIHRARRDRSSGMVSAVVALTAVCDQLPVRAFVTVCVPGRPVGAAPLRDRVLGAAKLAFAGGAAARTARAA